MDLEEAVHRVFVGHLKLIAGCLLLGATIGIALHLGDQTLYSSTTRLVLDAPDPDSQEASQVLSDTARGIATSVETIRTALKLSQTEIADAAQPDRLVARNPLDVALHHVQVEALGSSGVLALTVTDPDPTVAVALSKALAQAVVETRNQLSGGRGATVLNELDVQIDSLTARITSTNEKIVGIDVQIDGATTETQVLGYESQRSDLVRSLIDLTNRRSVLVTERAKVASDQALRPQAAIVDPARGPAEPVQSRMPADAALGALLGLVLGVGLAALIETIRPTIAGRSSFEREMSAPLLGELAGTPEHVGPQDLRPLVTNTALAAQTARVSRIELIGTDARIDLHLLAEELDASMAAPTSSNGRGVVVAPFDPRVSPNGAGSAHAPKRRIDRLGLIVVAPSVTKRASLEPILDIRSISGMPIIGVINYRQPRMLERSHGNSHGSRKSSNGSSSGSEGSHPADLEERV